MKIGKYFNETEKNILNGNSIFQNDNVHFHISMSFTEICKTPFGK